MRNRRRTAGDVSGGGPQITAAGWSTDAQLGGITATASDCERLPCLAIPLTTSF